MTQSLLAQHDRRLTGGQLPKYVDLGLLVVMIAVCAAVLAVAQRASLIGALVSGGIAFLIAIFAMSYWVEGRRRAVNRLAR